jgi:hypothetical protein
MSARLSRRARINHRLRHRRPTPQQKSSKRSPFGALETKLAMRTEAHKLQHVIARLPVNQYQIGLDVTVSMVNPIAG